VVSASRATATSTTGTESAPPTAVPVAASSTPPTANPITGTSSVSSVATAARARTGTPVRCSATPRLSAYQTLPGR
jgi:hypothetical protein